MAASSSSTKTLQIPAKLPSKYPKKIIEAYKEGGNPSLDGKHPVFGQVIDNGCWDKIAKWKKMKKVNQLLLLSIASKWWKTTILNLKTKKIQYPTFGTVFLLSSFFKLDY